MSELNLRLVLAQHLVMPSSGTHLYRYGISWFRFNQINRHFIHNPVFNFTIVLIYFIRCCLAMSIKENDNFYFYIGDFGYFIGAKYQSNVFLIIAANFYIFTQFINFFDYITGVKPLYLNPFKMMSGLVSPISVGLNSHNDVNKLLKISTFLLIYLPKVIPTFSSTGFIFSLQLLIFSFA